MPRSAPNSTARPSSPAGSTRPGFDHDDGRLLLRRSVDAQGRSRAWINGSAATAAQLREAADALLDIHGQHAWQSLTRPVAVRALLDAQAGVDPAPLSAAWQQWRARLAALESARAQRDGLARERERLAWQIGELEGLAPADGEWEALNAEHQRLAHGQSLIDAARTALDALADAEPAAGSLIARASHALEEVLRHDPSLAPVIEEIRSAQAQLEDAAHTLTSYLGRAEPDPSRLAELDTRLAAWLSLARRYRRGPDELPGLLTGWRAELGALDAAADLDALQRQASDAEAAGARRHFGCPSCGARQHRCSRLS